VITKRWQLLSEAVTLTEVFGTPRVGLEIQFFFRRPRPRDGTNQTFDNIFPPTHKHYGTWILWGWRNIHNPRLSASFKPASRC